MLGAYYLDRRWAMAFAGVSAIGGAVFVLLAIRAARLPVATTGRSLVLIPSRNIAAFPVRPSI